MLKKSTFAIAVAVLISLALAPATSFGQNLTGTWKCGSSVIEFSGKSGTILKEGVKSNFTIAGSEFEIANPDGTKKKVPFKMEGEKLAVTFDDITLKYKKK